MSDERKFDNPDNLKLHKDLTFIMRSIWTLIVVGFAAGVWATTLAADVAANRKAAADNKKEIDDRAAVIENAKTMQTTLTEIKDLLVTFDTRQRDMQTTLTKVETKVEALERKADK